MRLTEHAHENLSLHKPQNAHEEDFPPKAATSLLGGIAILLLLSTTALLLMLVVDHSKDNGSTIKTLFSMVALIGVVSTTVYILLRSLGKKIADFLNHYDDDNNGS